MITDLEQFVKACEAQSSDRIYEIFELEIDDNVYVHVMSHAEDEAMEPVRSALNRIGQLRGVQSLIDY